jgi:hypothetical protein
MPLPSNGVDDDDVIDEAEEANMWTTIIKSSALAALFLGLCAVPARAQEELTVKVPFQFVVQGHTMPAGDYVIQPIDDQPSVMMIRGTHANHNAHAIVLTNGVEGKDPAGETPVLSFTKIENQYRLATIWENATEGRSVSE